MRTAAPKRTTRTIGVDGRSLVISNENKVLWPEDGYTKGDLIGYYRSVARWIVPHLADRPLTVERYPNGIHEGSFFEKSAPRGMPDWIETVTVPTSSGRRSEVAFPLCNDEAALTYFANLAAIVLHVWTSRAGSLEVPDFIFFDLDPGEGCTLATLAKVALRLRETLNEIGLEPLIKTSGGSGLHVVVPLVPEYSYEIAKQFAELVARTLNGRMPKETTLARMPAKRPHGTVYLDYVQVGMGKTLTVPYGVRARAAAPVSYPLPWSEIEAMSRKRARGTEGEFERFTIKNVPGFLAEQGDLWSGAGWKEQRLEPALAKAREAWQ